jgi:hypothetical protein
MITEFENPDVEFLIIDGNYLEVGTDILFESEFMTTVELNEWANDNDIENDNIEEIIKLKNRIDLENGDFLSSPSSRAYDFFQELDFEISESLGVELIDGTQPGSDLRLVKLLNKEFLPQIQNLLLENHIKANFSNS